MTSSEMMKEISNRWSKMSIKEKKSYTDKAKADKLRYETELRAFKNSQAESLEKSVVKSESFRRTRKAKMPRNQFVQPILRPRGM